MLSKTFFTLIYVVLCIFTPTKANTPAIDIRAVVITSEIVKPTPLNCNKNENFYSPITSTTEKLTKLRQEMFRKNVSAYIVLPLDEHQSEFISRSDRRLEYITGFTGSNGIAVITLKLAALWTDSRYYIQAENEVDSNWMVMKMGLPETPSVENWIASQLQAEESVSSDPKICAAEKWLAWKKTFSKYNIKLELLQENLIDNIWHSEGQPESVNAPIFVLDLKFAGVSWQNKLDLIREDMKKSGVDIFVIVALDEIAWTLNLRGADIPFFPVFKSYLIIQMDEATLYVSQKKLTPEVLKHLNSNHTSQGQFVQLKEYNEIWEDLRKLSKTCGKIGLPSKYSYFSGINYMLYNSVPEEKVSLMTSPALLRKDYKNPVEVKGMKSSHVRDGLVVCQLFSMMEKDITAGKKNWTELKAVSVINNLRAKQLNSAGISFGTISAFGKNAASAHYQPTKESDTVIDDKELFMLDSGGQYLDGTTDVTRTVHFGTPKDIEREIYTRLLKGCIDVATVTFKEGYTMQQLEILIRAPLYEIGLEYGHGSTHGIGSFLGVHEAFNTTYHINFFGSQEPGYYESNKFGMRLENIVRVIKSSKTENSHGNFFTFETITLVPYERKLIKVEMLEKKHINWLNEYHQKVLKLVGAEMLKQGLIEDYQWLKTKTEPISWSQ